MPLVSLVVLNLLFSPPLGPTQGCHKRVFARQHHGSHDADDPSWVESFSPGKSESHAPGWLKKSQACGDLGPGCGGWGRGKGNSSGNGNGNGTGTPKG